MNIQDRRFSFAKKLNFSMLSLILRASKQHTYFLAEPLKTQVLSSGFFSILRKLFSYYFPHFYRYFAFSCVSTESGVISFFRCFAGTYLLFRTFMFYSLFKTNCVHHDSLRYRFFNLSIV